jgi:adenylosuccinate synthase
MLPGWKQDISACRKYEDLPENARLYIETLERLLDCDIQFISTGAERNEYMIKGEWI